MRKDERRRTDEEYQLLADVYCFVATKKDRLYRKRNNKRKVYTVSNVSLAEFFRSIYSNGDVQSSEVHVFKNFEEEYGDDIDSLYYVYHVKPCTYRRKFFNMYIHGLYCKSLSPLDFHEISKRMKQGKSFDPNVNIISAINLMRSVNHSYDIKTKKAKFILPDE